MIDLTGQPYRKSRLAKADLPCALAELSRCSPTRIMLWDHCHRDGLIRGPVCVEHNHILAMFDAGYFTMSSERWWPLHFYSLRCPACSERRDRWLAVFNQAIETRIKVDR